LLNIERERERERERDEVGWVFYFFFFQVRIPEQVRFIAWYRNEMETSSTRNMDYSTMFGCPENG